MARTRLRSPAYRSTGSQEADSIDGVDQVSIVNRDEAHILNRDGAYVVNVLVR